jgi:hypothetical protein
MMKEDLSNLGFGENPSYTRVQSDEGLKEKEGFISGTNVKASKKSVFW